MSVSTDFASLSSSTPSFWQFMPVMPERRPSWSASVRSSSFFGIFLWNDRRLSLRKSWRSFLHLWVWRFWSQKAISLLSVFQQWVFFGTRFCRSRSFCDNSAEKSDPEDRRDQSCQLRNVCRRHFDLLHDAALGDQRTLDAHGNRGSGFCRRIRDCRSILVLFEEHRIHSAGINFDSCFLWTFVRCGLMRSASGNFV